MAELTATAKRIGGSIYVPIPAHVAKEEGIEEGKTVRVVVVARERRGKGILGMFPQVREFQRSERLWNE